jgi:hypothetical protein
VTTVVPFIPSNIRAPSFHAILDGSDRNIVVTWNVAAQRYFINVYDMDGTWRVTTPIITSPPGENVTSFRFDPAAKSVTVVKATGLRRKPGTIMRYWFSGFQPAAINGLYPRCLVLDTLTFTYPAAADPGPVTVLGTVHRRLSMVAGIFLNSTLIYRNGAFEIDP